jgi:hypothetical protein
VELSGDRDRVANPGAHALVADRQARSLEEYRPGPTFKFQSRVCWIGTASGLRGWRTAGARFFVKRAYPVTARRASKKVGCRATPLGQGPVLC